MKIAPWCWAVCVAAVTVCVASCGGGSDAEPCSGCGDIASITTSPGTISITPGQQVAFSAVAFDAQGKAIDGVTFTWASSDTSVATVNDAGVATGVTAGLVTIRASARGVTSAGAALTVAAPPSGGSSSDALIDAALAAGQIDAETAIIYKVYAVFNDQRLPGQYKGNNGDGHSPILAELIGRFETLSAPTQELLMPFLRRPASVDSWTDPNRVNTSARPRAAVREQPQQNQPGLLRPDCRVAAVLETWADVSAPGGKVRVWYDTAKTGHKTAATFVSNEMETKAWPTLIGTLGFTAPLNDSSVLGCDGGDGRLDVYIVDANLLGDRGATTPDFWGGNPRQGSTYIMLKADTNARMEQSLAHELMHAIQWAQLMAAPQLSYGWIRDAIANWAVAEVYPQHAELHKEATCYMRSPHLSIDDRSKGHCHPDTSLNRDYGAYLLFQYLSKSLAGSHPTVVRDILAATFSKSTGVDAIEHILGTGGGLKKYWPEFAKVLWNQPPFGLAPKPTSFEQWDNMTEKPVLAPDLPNFPTQTPESGDLGGQLEASTELDARINNLSSKYYHFKFVDIETRSLMFHNTFYDNWKAMEKVNVRALWRLEGATNWDGDEDWTDLEWIGLCRDRKLQRLAELVIIVSSAEWVPTNPKVVAAKKPRLMRNDLGCYAFKGLATRTFRHKSWASGQTLVTMAANFDRPLQYTSRPEGRMRVPLAPGFSGGRLTYNESFVSSGCSYVTNETFDAFPKPAGDEAASLTINYFNEALPPAFRSSQERLVSTASRAYVGAGVSTRILKGRVSGPQPNCGTVYESGVGSWLLTNGTDANGAPTGQPIAAPNHHLDFTFTSTKPSDSTVEKYGWDLVPQRE
jgi:hypothetical protein